MKEPTRLKLSESIIVGLTPKELKWSEETERGFWLKAAAGNSGDILVGNQYQQKYPLAAGAEIFIPAEDGIYVLGSAGADEVQEVSLTGSPTGGTFTLTFNGEETAAIAFNATANDVKTALEALNGIDQVNTSGGPLPGTAVDVTFVGVHSGVNVAELTGDGTGLTGGTTPDVGISTTTAGSGQQVDFLVL